MSLVGDALRKARREAAERDVDRRGVLYSAKIAEPRSRSHLGLGLALGAAIAVVATIAGGAAVWWIVVRENPQPRVADRSTQAQPIRESVSTAPSADGGGDSGGGRDSVSVSGRDNGSGGGRASNGGRGGDSGSIGSSGGAQSQGAVVESAAPADPRNTELGAVDGAEAEGGGAVGRDPGETPGSEAEAPSTGYAGTEDGDEVYILEAELGDTTLSLDYIVFRGEDPFAEINGVEVHLGATVGGFRVKSIEKDRVRLSDGRRNIVLRAP